MHLDTIDRWVLAERQLAATLVAGGAKVPEPQTFEQARAAFERALLGEPKQNVDPEKLELMRALGVA